MVQLKLLSRTLFCIFLAVVMLLSPSAAFADTEQKKIVRIGFYPLNGFHEYNSDGQPIGYDVDYLSQISEYAGWDYEFVPVENQELAFHMLDEGKIDLLGGIRKTEAAAQKYAFSAYSAGTTYSALITAADGESYIYEDYLNFSNLKVGCVASSPHEQSFRSYASQKGFTPDISYYDSLSQARQDLRAGNIDGVLGSILSLKADERVLARFSPVPFYYISSKENTLLMDALNEAQARLKIFCPSLEAQLIKTYFPQIMLEPFNKEELDFIAQCPPLKTGYFVSRKPLSYTDASGNAAGVIPDLLEQISLESGLTFELVPIGESAAIADCFQGQDLDLLAGVMNDAVNRSDPSCTLTDSILLSSIALYSREGSSFSPDAPLSIAIPAGWHDGIRYAHNTYPHYKVQQYPDTEQCLKAVQNGECQLLLHNVSTIRYLLQKPVYQDIISIPSSSAYEDTCIAISKKNASVLGSILNKSISLITDEQRDRILSENLTNLAVPFTFFDLFYEYKGTILSISGSFLLIIAILTYAVCLRRKNEKIAIENQRQLANITNNLNGGVITLKLDQHMTMLYTNYGFWQLLGYEGKPGEQERLETYIHPDDFTELKSFLFKEGEPVSSIVKELRLCHQEQQYLPVLFRGSLLFDERTKESLLYCVVVDITYQKKMLDLLQMEKERYRIILDQSDDIIFDLDQEKGEFLCSQNFIEKFGWQCKTAHDRRSHPDDAKALAQLSEQILAGERYLSTLLRIPAMDGRYLWCRVQITCLNKTGQPLRLVGKIVDLDHLIREREALEWQSQRDSLTDLYNKKAFQTKLEHFLQNPPTAEKQGAVLFIDLDNFKSLNDTLGHIAGDKALVTVSQTLKRIFRNAEAISRFGGDEFCVFLRDTPKSALLKQIEAVCNTLRLYFYEDGQPMVDISTSIGVYFIQSDDSSCEAVLKKADKALYAAKQAGKNQFIFYDDL